MPDETPLIRFGVIADPQYAPLPPNLTFGRHYDRSLEKLSAAIDVFNAQELAFVVTLGDLIDRGSENLDAVLECYRPLRHESLALPGNHDFAVAPEMLPQVHARLSMPAPYHHFLRAGIRFVVIDGSEESLFSVADDDPRHAVAARRLEVLKAKGAVNAQAWNGGIGEDQREWLRDVLDRAAWDGEQVIVMGHYPLYPENQHNQWDWENMVDLFGRSGNVLAYLCGHNHAGNLGRHGNTWFVNFKGMVDTPDDNSFAVVEIFPDRIEVIGHGREDSRTLPL